MSEAYQLFESLAKQMPDASLSQMFGKPCFKYNKKAFCCFFEDCMVFKLSEEALQEALLYKGATLFDPSKKGRAMKSWVQVPYSHAQHWEKYTTKSYAYLKSILA